MQEINSPGHTRQKDIEVKGFAAKPHIDQKQRNQINRKLMTQVVTRCSLVPSMNSQPGHCNQDHDADIHVRSPARLRRVRRAGHHEDGCRDQQQGNKKDDGESIGEKGHIGGGSVRQVVFGFIFRIPTHETAFMIVIWGSPRLSGRCEV